MKMTINNGVEVIENTNSITKLTFTGYWVFAGKYLPANVADMPTSKYFDGSLDDLILVSENNNLIDKYNFHIPKLDLIVETDLENCSSTSLELKIETSELNTEYRLWNETTNSWFSDAVIGNFDEIILSGYSDIAETSEIMIFAENTNTNCSKFLDTIITVNIYPTTQILSEPEGSTICESDNYTLSINVEGHNLNYQWKKDTENIGTNSNTLTISNAQLTDAGNYYCKITGFCGDVTSNIVTLTVLEQPAANAGTNVEICGNTIMLDATNPSPLTGVWSIISGTATIQNSNIFNSTVTDASYGDVVFAWTVDNGYCQNTDFVTITFYENIEAITSPDFDICIDNGNLGICFY
jgi:hypothetical protein